MDNSRNKFKNVYATHSYLWQLFLPQILMVESQTVGSSMMHYIDQMYV